ncbi:DnaE-like DNA polymerase III (alpha) [Gordonia phage Clawz]|uniref:DnaE-like DNA polymerase III alpha n=1 Tax=Gordonia phage Clawz TaxID=2743910 RepID=A0AAE7K6W4_9CAUD|nr:DnaE-like DNA polymerase III (alpha) [Gordonia phage Clawz]QKY79930.1 DnaE-like DNA polymerase III alpha [Gordonia phage Clawz]
MNYTVEDRFISLATYGTRADLDDSDLFAAATWSTSGYRLWPTEHWPDRPDAAQLNALPWLKTFTADEPFRQTVERTVDMVSAVLSDADEYDGIVCMWNAPQTLGLLYGVDRALHLPKSILDLRVLDRQLNPDRRGRRTLWTTAAEYGIEFSDHTPETEGKALVRTARAMLAYHQLAMPFQDLMGQQKVWHYRQSEDLVRWMQKNKRRGADRIDRGWPVRDDQRLWHAQILLEDWLTGTTASDTDVRAAVETLLDWSTKVAP